MVNKPEMDIYVFSCNVDNIACSFPGSVPVSISIRVFVLNYILLALIFDFNTTEVYLKYQVGSYYS